VRSTWGATPFDCGPLSGFDSHFLNRRINNPFVGPSELTFGSIQCGKSGNFIMQLWANQKTESYVYRWLRAHAMVDETCFLAFVEASNIIKKNFKYSTVSCMYRLN